MALENTEKKVFFDSSVYSAEAVDMAVFILEDRMNLSVEKKENGVVVSFKSFLENFPEIFANEVLNQQCRLDVAEVTSDITKLIVSKALVSAVGGAKKNE